MVPARAPVDLLLPGVVLAPHLGAAEVGGLVEKPETRNTNLVDRPDRPSSLSNQPASFLQSDVDFEEGDAGDLLDDDEVAGIDLPSEISRQHPRGGRPQLSRLPASPRFQHDPTRSDPAVGLE